VKAGLFFGGGDLKAVRDLVVIRETERRGNAATQAVIEQPTLTAYFFLSLDARNLSRLAAAAPPERPTK